MQIPVDCRESRSDTKLTREKWGDVLCWFILCLTVMFLIAGIVFFAVQIVDADWWHHGYQIQTDTLDWRTLSGVDGKLTFHAPVYFTTPFKMTWVETTWRSNEDSSFWWGQMDTITHIATLAPIMSSTAPENASLCDSVRANSLWLNEAWDNFLEMLNDIGWTLEEWLEHKEEWIK